MNRRRVFSQLTLGTLGGRAGAYGSAEYDHWKGASPLLAITETAAAAIKGLTSSGDQPEEAGVRIAAREGADVASPDGLELSLAEGPAEDDEVIDEHGAHVYLESRAASYLDDKLLDAQIDGQQVRFAVSTQG